MPRYEVETAETIHALRRKVQRDENNEFPFNPVARGTNRGNKLKREAKNVWRGGLASMSGINIVKERVEHAGYTRFILSPKPPRINAEGEELVDSETDEEADAMAVEMDPYSGIDLTETLGPLKHPSELLTHPSMSHPYVSEALPNQVKDTREKLRQEQDILWKVKELGRHFTGDTPFMPCGETETVDGIDLFPSPSWPAKSKKRKRDDRISATASLTEAPSASGALQALSVVSGEKVSESLLKASRPPKLNGTSEEHKESHEAPVENAEDILQGLTNGNIDHSVKPAHTNGIDRPTAVENGDGSSHSDTTETKTNGKFNNGEMSRPREIPANNQAIEDKSADSHLVDGDSGNQPPEQKDENPTSISERTPSPQPPPQRRITRALAQNHNSSATHSANPSPPASPSTSAPSIHPLYALPPSFRTSTTYGLPSAEATETRRLLSSYIQKQEETVRGYEELLNKLLKAQRLRKTVMVWCKAEGHVGEMSDGEDWIDTAAWGLGPGELKKGRDEEEMGEEERERERERGGGRERDEHRHGHGRDGGGERVKKGKRRRG